MADKSDPPMALIYQEFTDEILVISPQDHDVLRSLAGRVAELAARPEEQEKKELWYQLNDLQSARPVVSCHPENAWNEIIRADDLMCAGELARRWEMALRMEIFWAEEIGDDRVVQAFLDVPHVYEGSDWGVETTMVGGEHGGSYVWHAPITDYDMLDQLHFPEITVDAEMSERVRALAEGTLGDLITVRQRTTWFWTQGLTWLLANLRGLEQIMLDTMDHPDDLHRLMAFLRDGQMAKLDFLEERGLLSLNNDGTYCGSGGYGWSRDLPQPDFDGHVRLGDLWGFGESQETVGISPDMFAEFIYPYQVPLMARFGLIYYGCCEPLDKRWPIVKDTPNLRRVSVSPWADRATMAEYLGDQYIYVMKPKPADLAMNQFDEERLRMELRADLRTTRGCHVEVCMKDTHTVRNDPGRLVRWTRMAREEAEAL